METVTSRFKTVTLLHPIGVVQVAERDYASLQKPSRPSGLDDVTQSTKSATQYLPTINAVKGSHSKVQSQIVAIARASP